MDDKTYSCRLKPNERSHLREYWNNVFSDFVHTAFKHDIDMVQNNKRKNRMQSYSSSIILVAIGFFFLFNLFNIIFFSLAWFLMFALGTCFSIWGVTNFALEIREYKKKRLGRKK